MKPFFLIRNLTLTLIIIWSTVSLYAQFQDLSSVAGIDNTGQNRGIAIIDFDRDGWEDLYVTRLDGPNLLYHNNGDGTFTDKATSAGVNDTNPSGTSVWGDLDNDGWPDLVVGNRDEESQVYQNLGDGTFENITLESGIYNKGKTMSVNLADVDNDGWLDIYFANLGSENALFHNNGDGTFSDYTYPSGALDDGIAMGAVFFDYDLDGDQDLYLTHDANQPNILYQNTGYGSFIDVSESSGLHLAAQGMGVDIADVNHDGYLDVYVTNLYENVLFQNRGDGTFLDISAQTSTTDRGMGWGIVFFDYDNDSWPDIYVANESNFGVDFKNYDNILYRNLGSLNFQTMSDDPALKSPFGGYGLASADLDLNGQLDLFIANSGQSGNQILWNHQEPEEHWIQIKLEGSISNRSAIGARIELQLGESVLVDQITAGSGFASQHSLILHFGLGEADQIDSLSIYWPSGTLEIFEDVSVNQSLQIIENAGIVSNDIEKKLTSYQLQVSPNPTTGSIKLRLNSPNYVDYGTFSLLNTTGQLVYQEVSPIASSSVEKDFQFDGTMPSGLYFLVVTIGELVFTEKIFYVGQP